MKCSIEHLGLASPQPTELRDWYVNVLGAETIMQLADDPPAWMIRLPGGMWLEIYAADFSLKETSDNKLRGWRHLAVCVDSLESAKGELAAKGVRFTENAKPAGGGGRVLFFQDPDGNLLHLVERPEGWSAE